MAAIRPIFGYLTPTAPISFHMRRFSRRDEMLMLRYAVSERSMSGKVRP